IRDLTVTGVQTCALPISPRFAERSDYNNSLFHGIGRHDFDAFDHDPFRRLAHLACAISRDWNLADFFQDVRAFDQLAERGVLPRSEERRVGKGRRAWGVR